MLYAYRCDPFRQPYCRRQQTLYARIPKIVLFFFKLKLLLFDHIENVVCGERKYICIKCACAKGLCEGKSVILKCQTSELHKFHFLK